MLYKALLCRGSQGVNTWKIGRLWLPQHLHVVSAGLSDFFFEGLRERKPNWFLQIVVTNWFLRIGFSKWVYKVGRNQFVTTILVISWGSQIHRSRRQKFGHGPGRQFSSTALCLKVLLWRQLLCC